MGAGYVDQPQFWAVVFIVAGAAGYLALALRRSLRGKDSCCGSRCCPTIFPGQEQDRGCARGDRPDATGAQPTSCLPGTCRDDGSPPQAFIPVEHLADVARQRRRERGEASEAPPAS